MDLYIRDHSIAQRAGSCNKKKCITVYKEKVQALQDSAAVYVAKTDNSATQLRDWVHVQNVEHGIWYAKFKAADQLRDWMLENPKGLSYWCNLTRCDLPWAPLPVFIGFRDHFKGVGSLVSEQRAKLDTLKSDCVGE